VASSKKVQIFETINRPKAEKELMTREGIIVDAALKRCAVIAKNKDGERD